MEETELKENQLIQKDATTLRSNSLVKLTIGILFLGLVWLVYWLLVLQYYAFTDDAYVNGNMVGINSAVSGSVVAYYADDTDFVAEGQLLVQLDDTHYRLSYEKELETLASVCLDVQQLYDKVGTTKALVKAKEVLVGRALYDYENRSKLIGSKAVSNEDFVHAKDSLFVAEAELQQAKMELQAALDAVGSVIQENHPLIEKQKAIVRSAYWNLEHCSIYAPIAGYIAQRNVEIGQWVTPASSLMAVIPTDYMWVDANYKETQLTYMRVGQPASVWVDLYGSGLKFEGKVLGIGSGTGSVFSIIPPQNATGNWIKVVQRLPVRVGIDPEMLKKYPLRLGLSVEVDVDLTNQDLPMLNSQKPVRPIAKTDVFTINYTAVNELMDDIVRSNMN